MRKLTVLLVLAFIVSGLAFAAGATEQVVGKPVELVYTMTAVPTDAHAGAMRVFRKPSNAFQVETSKCSPMIPLRYSSRNKKFRR